MEYMIMIYESDAAFHNRTGENKAAYWGAWKAYTEALRKAGVMTGGHGLQPPLSATTVRVKGDARTVQDGPYAEAKEQLGGYYILDPGGRGRGARVVRPPGRIPRRPLARSRRRRGCAR